MKITVKKTVITLTVIGLGMATLMLVWMTNPMTQNLELPDQLRAYSVHADSLSALNIEYSADYQSLVDAFEAQTALSFCGPASLATVLGSLGQDIDQNKVFPSLAKRLDILFSGTSLEELKELAISNQLEVKVFYASEISLDEFRTIIKQNMQNREDYLIVNYHREAVYQVGGGHISPIASYNPETDEVLILDTASYKYPFTWVPVTLLYDAAATIDKSVSRGLLVMSNKTQGAN